MDLKNNIRSALLTGGYFAAGPTKNTPAQYGDRQTQYLAEVTELFNAEYAKYASDYFTGTLEYFDENGNTVSSEETFRFANVVRPTAAITRDIDAYKEVLFDNRAIDYVQPGAKLTTCGSVWLAYNPDNISSVTPNAIFRRCNAVWNHLDYYGNVLSEPIIFEPERANASTPDAQNTQMVSRGYYNVICQYNEWTRQIDDNTRIILGDKSYQVTGFGDFSMEFTGDYDSVRVLRFTIRVETKNRATDDMQNHVAGGKVFSWVPTISGPAERGVGEGKFLYTVNTARNGAAVSSSTANPFSYAFSVDAEGIVEIQPVGNNQVWVTPISQGTVNLTATLRQNPKIYAEMEITVSSGIHEAVKFTTAAPAAPLEPYQSVKMIAYYYDDTGAIDTSVPITFTGSGADPTAYRIDVESIWSVTVTCLGYSETPLTLTATGGPDYAAPDTAEIWLEGY